MCVCVRTHTHFLSKIGQYTPVSYGCPFSSSDLPLLSSLFLLHPQQSPQQVLLLFLEVWPMPEGSGFFVILSWMGCGRVYVAVVKHPDQKQIGEERVYFSSQLSGHSLSLREIRDPGQELKRKAWRSAGYSWLAQLFFFFFSFFPLYHSGPPAWVSTSHNGLGSPISVIKGNALQVCL